ncbi:MAG: endo-1,4-beta-xylanase [Kiritimatiellia bacterium]
MNILLASLFAFRLGAAVGPDVYMDPENDASALVAQTFDSITAENEMKPEALAPREGEFNWVQADRFVAFGTRHGMKVIGHCLVWHNQMPSWFFTDANGGACDRETLIARMRTYIHTVVGRYRGRIAGWDVVNEAFDANGRLHDSPWTRIIGGDFMELAFRFAHEADPSAELYYNDFGMAEPGRRAGVVAMIREFRAKGVPIHGIGMQSHVSLTHPDLGEYETSLAAFAAEGVKVMISELDVSVLPSAWNLSAEITRRLDYGERYDPWKDGRLPAEKQRELAERYRALFRIYRRYPAVDRVTLWGVSDRQSWLNDFPMRGRTDYPLLFDRALKPKPCYAALKELAAEPSPPPAPLPPPVCPQAKFTHFTYQGEDALPAFDPATHYYNPIIGGMGPDPAITRKGNDYYLAHSSFGYFPGIPVYHSTDLVSWDFCGYVGNRRSNLALPAGLDLSAGVFAPDIKYNPHNDTFYLIVTVIGDRGNVVYKTKDPYLGWSEPIPVPVGGIDPGFCFEDAKTAWIVNNDDAPDNRPEYPGHRTVRIRQYDLTTDTCVPGTERILINKGVRPEEKPIWCEGPHLYKIDGRYYLMTAEGGTGGGHSEVVWTGDSPTGPFKPAPVNPILTQRDLPNDRPNPVTAAGHADLFQTADGSWQAVFLGILPYEKGGRQMCNTGRSTFLLPVEWIGEGETRQPIILSQGKSVPRVLPRPLPAAKTPGLPLTGNPCITDDFSTPMLDAAWFALRGDLRTRQAGDWADFWAVAARDGAGLMLAARPVSLDEKADPSYLCRWVRNASFTAEITVDFAATSDGDFAGLAYYQNERHFYAVGRTKGAVVLKRRNGAASKTLVRVPLATPSPVRVRVVARGGTATFAYATSSAGAPRVWRPLGETYDASILSTDHAGGFVACTLGPVAWSKSDE